MKGLIIIATLSTLILLGAFSPAFATHPVPFNGRMSGSGTATSQTTNSIVATVHLQHFGKSRLVGTTTVTGTSACGGFVGTEVDTITASNGDKILVSGDGVSCPVSANPIMFQDNVTFTITGGTGRFEHASGSGVVHTAITITSPSGDSTFSASITGTITY